MTKWVNWILTIGVLMSSIAAGQNSKMNEIARGHSWVSPYWGYNTPKIVFDGSSYFTTGLWGTDPDQSHGVVYGYEGTSWQEGMQLPDIYQPATLALDPDRRLLVVYARKGKPVCVLRSISPGNIREFEDLPSPPDMTEAYYIGIAIKGNSLYLAHLAGTTNNMYITSLDLGSRKWTSSLLVSEGKTGPKPRVAWTYPILQADDAALHLVASNAPDGGEGNTYNEVWYVRMPLVPDRIVSKEKVAECPMGYLAYATDMTVEKASGAVHVAMMFNHKVYGEDRPLSEPEGTYHARRDPESGQWYLSRLGPMGITGFGWTEQELGAFSTEGGTVVERKWQAESRDWSEPVALFDAKGLPGAPSFLDVLSLSSGSVTKGGPAMVTDSLLPSSDGKPQERILWAVLPKER